MKTKILFATLLVFFCLATAGFATISDFGTFKQGTDINLWQTCVGCSYCNITKVISPNATTLISNAAMTGSNNAYTYLLSGGNTSTIGTYTVIGIGDEGGTASSFSYTFLVNDTATRPSEWLIISFMLLFILLLFVVLYTLIETFNEFSTLNISYLQVIKCFTVYGAVVTFNYFNIIYLGNKIIDSFTNIFIYVGGFTHIVIPLLILTLSVTLGKLRRERAATDNGGFNNGY